MNVREEDRKKASCSGRGFGLATAAIGLGVGAALYYFLSKGSPQQETEASSSSSWGCEQPNVFPLAENTTDTDSYSTISEGTTTDTSIHDMTFPRASSMELEDDMGSECDNESPFQTSISATSESHNTTKSSSVSDNSFTSTESDSVESVSDYNWSNSHYSQSSHSTSDAENDCTESDKESDYADSEAGSDYAMSDNSEDENDYSESDVSMDSDEENVPRRDGNFNFIFENASNTESLETGYTSFPHNRESDESDGMDWDVTNTSIGIPSGDRSSSLLNIIGVLATTISPRKAPQEDRLSKLREQAFRDRPWTVEDCSICFDVMQRHQEIMTLSCAHNFHAQCIMPWLQEKQTCPNCRKLAE